MDTFILARLEAAGLAPSPQADKRTLLRRVCFDLTGLPPTPEEQDAFLNDDRPGAYERLVERLLASPHYGERWAQHWFDVVRYGESNGYEADGERPHAWRYRDYVIHAFNSDESYATFLREQIAGDELAVQAPAERRAELLTASFFHRCGPVHVVGGNIDPEVNRQEYLTEMAQGIAVVCGLTLGCARCHDHKFDPVSQADYYRLQAFFAATDWKDVDLSTPAQRQAHARADAAVKARMAPLQKALAELEAPYHARLLAQKRAQLAPTVRHAVQTPSAKRTAEQKRLAEQAAPLLKITWDEIVAALTPADRDRRTALRAELHARELQRPPPLPHAPAVQDRAQVPPTYLLRRGSVKQKGAVVSPAFPSILCSGSSVGPPRLGGLGASAARLAAPTPKRLTRIDLANWLTSPAHPLTARVMVNRIWQHHFGKGLVTTPNDFGHHGARPSHPDLLDWLATEFVRSGWSIKHLHRLLVLSATYRQQSAFSSRQSARTDPDNKLLWRMNRQRLEGEALRDSMLAVAGALNRQIGGPMVRVPLEPEVYNQIFTEGEPDHLWDVTPDQAQHDRRSVYLFAKRNVHLPLLEAFDRPDLLTSCPVRPVSTFAPQALILMNGPFARKQAERLAERLVREAGPAPAQQVERAYRLLFARAPTKEERRIAREFLTGPQALTDYCLALLNTNEFVYVP